jgi:hypothetical protein
VPERGLGAVGSDNAAGDELLVTGGGQRNHADDAAGQGDGTQHAFDLRRGACRDQRRNDQEGGPHDDDSDDYERVLGEEQTQHPDQQESDEKGVDRAWRNATGPTGYVKDGSRSGQEKEQLARRETEIAPNPEGEQLQRDGQQSQRDAHHRLPDHDRDDRCGGKDSQCGERSHRVGHVRPGEGKQSYAEKRAEQANWASDTHGPKDSERIKRSPKTRIPTYHR